MQIKPYMRKVFFYETDQMGVVHHSNYIRWFEEARTDFMDQIGYGYDKVTESGIDIALLSVSCDYKVSVKFGETVLILMSFSQITPTRMTLSYEIYDSEKQQLKTVGKTNHFYHDRQTNRPVSILKRDPELHKLFMNYYDSTN